jgi:hypothetical protein
LSEAGGELIAKRFGALKKVEVIMRLKIDIDDALLNKAFSRSKARTVEELIHDNSYSERFSNFPPLCIL